MFHFVNKDGKIHYLSKTNKVLIRRLAQKVYDLKLLKKAQALKNTIQKALKMLSKNNMDEVFEKLPEAVKPLVNRYETTDEEFAAAWETAWKNTNPNQTPYITYKGEYVRSKSEQLIANLLYELGIPYRYEYPYTFKRPNGGGYITIHPDFTVLNKRTRKEFVLEHLGRLDDPQYQEMVSIKMTTYFANGWFSGNPLLYTSETGECPLNIREARRMFEEILL